MNYSKEIFEQLIKYTPAAVAMFDKDMKYIAHSERWLTDYQITDGSIIGKSHYEVFPDILDRWKKDHIDVLNGATIIKEEDEWKRDDGSSVFIRYRLNPWRNSSGEIGGLIMFTEVITAFIENRNQLNKTNTYLESIFKASPDVILILDKNQKVTDLKLGQNYEIFEDELLGKSLNDIFSRKLKSDTIKNYISLESEKNNTEIYTLRTDNNLEYFEARISPYLEDSSIVTLRKVTSLIKANLALDQSEEKLNFTNLNLEQFAYVAAHDVRETVRNIYNFSQILELKLKEKLTEEEQQYLNIILNNSKRLDVLNENLLSYSTFNLAAVEKENIFFSPLLNSSFDKLKNQYKEKDIRFIIDNLPKSIRAYKQQIDMLFFNLLDNAIKFNKSSVIEIQVDYKRTDQSHQFKISDNGIGIDKIYANKIFEIFQTLEPQENYQGQGMGLCICKRIMDIHGGQIWHEENKPRGSQFLLEFPIEN